MSTLSGQENLNELTQQLNSVTDNSTFADHQLNSEAASVPHSEHSDSNWINNLFVTTPDTGDILSELCDDDKLLNPELGFGLEPGSKAALSTVEMNPNWESYRKPMSSLRYGESNPNANELPQPFSSNDNSQIDVDRAWCLEPDQSHLDQAGQVSNKPRLTSEGKAKRTSSKGCNGKKRKAREPVILTEEKTAERRKKKREADKKYRADNKMELNELRRMKREYFELMEIVSRFGGVAQTVSFINHSILLGLQKTEEAMSHAPELMKSKNGGIEKMGSIDMVAESHTLNQIKSKLGIQESESIVEKFSEMEDELHILKQKFENQKDLESSPPSPGNRQQNEMHERQPGDFIRFKEMKSKFGGIDEMEFKLDKFHEMETQLNNLKGREEQLQQEQEPPSLEESPGPGSLQCGISLNSSAAVSGTTPDLLYSDVLVDQLIQSLTDDDDVSNLVDLDTFQDLLEGDRKIVGKYKIPTPLVSTAQNIFKVHGDITKKSKFCFPNVQDIFVLFCAAIKEMGDRSLEEVTEEIILKLRDPIKDAKRIEFDVEFAMKYLKTLIQGYFGLKAQKDRKSLEQTTACLRAEEEALRKELGKKSQQIKAMEAKQRDLKSEKCKICLESAEKILCKTVSIF